MSLQAPIRRTRRKDGHRTDRRSATRNSAWYWRDHKEKSISSC